jgi:high affinity Mn2+ porin
VAPHWSARVEYLYTGLDNRNKIFPATPEAFDSNLSLHQVRFGLNYKLFDDIPSNSAGLPTKAPAGVTEDIWAVHGQTTFVEQYAAPFRAP